MLREIFAELKEWVLVEIAKALRYTTIRGTQVEGELPAGTIPAHELDLHSDVDLAADPTLQTQYLLGFDAATGNWVRVRYSIYPGTQGVVDGSGNRVVDGSGNAVVV